MAANELVILSLTDYQAMYYILGTPGVLLEGRVFVNLSSDTPNRSREASSWLAERGAKLIVGGIMVPADIVGQDGAYVFYSGPKGAFDLYEPTLRLISRAAVDRNAGEFHALACHNSTFGSVLIYDECKCCFCQSK